MLSDLQSPQYCQERMTIQVAIATFATSLILHLLAATLFQPPPFPKLDQTLTMRITPLARENDPTPTQIVSPPKRLATDPPPQTPLLSDYDSSTNREQLRRGDHPEAGATQVISTQTTDADSPSSTLTKTNPRPQTEASTPKLGTQQQPLAGDTLDLSPDLEALNRIAKNLSNSPQQIELDATKNDLGILSTNPQPFSRPPGQAARFLGQKGSVDYLPHIEDGDITLLNTKAEKYAVFVRRVAIQVFTNIKILGWRRLSAPQIASLNEYVTIKATLAPDGKLESASIVSTSGSPDFDNVIRQSVAQGANDPHPPATAAGPDGKFHFIFLARSHVQLYSGSRGHPGRERRWLLLRTGLE